MLERLRVNPSRLSLQWVSAAEAPRFVSLITGFSERMRELGPLGSSEGLDVDHLKVKLRAMMMALEGKRLRMVVARQAKFMNQGNTYREIPPDHKLMVDWQKTVTEETASQALLLLLRERARPVDELAGLLDMSSEEVIECFEKLEKKQLVEADRLILE
jgi:hypothetical protein